MKRVGSLFKGQLLKVPDILGSAHVIRAPECPLLPDTPMSGSTNEMLLGLGVSDPASRSPENFRIRRQGRTTPSNDAIYHTRKLTVTVYVR